MVDYAEKARKLREAIFDHAEQGHGGPCLRSGPLDKLLEDWLRANFAPQAPSYPYGERIAYAAPGVTREELLKPEPAPMTHGPMTIVWQGEEYHATLAPQAQGIINDDADHIGYSPREMAPADAREFRAQHLADPTPLIDKSAPIGDHPPSHAHQRTTYMEMLENLRRRRGFTPD